MFEKLCRKTGLLLIPTGEYEDSEPVYKKIEVQYFAMDKADRKDGVSQIKTQYYCKGYDSPAPDNCQLQLEDGTIIHAGEVEFLFNHFRNTPEFNVITAVNQ